jgi:hypothetical protein
MPFKNNSWLDNDYKIKEIIYHFCEFMRGMFILIFILMCIKIVFFLLGGGEIGNNMSI